MYQFIDILLNLQFDNIYYKSKRNSISNKNFNFKTSGKCVAKQRHECIKICVKKIDNVTFSIKHYYLFLFLIITRQRHMKILKCIKKTIDFHKLGS